MFDFIVVGSGPAGTCLASRLARSKAAPTVLLIEAGAARDFSMRDSLSERWISFHKYPELNWQYKTKPQEHLGGRVIDYSRGRGLGGSTIINIACYTVGPKDDYDRWAQEVGDEAFSWKNACRMRQNIEALGGDLSEGVRKHTDLDMSTHGTKGPLNVQYVDNLDKISTSVMHAAAQSKSLGNCQDLNGGTPLGLGLCPTTGLAVNRVTATIAYLSHVPDNLTIVTDAQVTRIIFEGKKAVGVVAGGKEYRATNEIIISAGAVDTPKILMLSGVGDRTELAGHGIDPVHHLPGVGNGLEDHIWGSMQSRVKRGLSDWPSFFNNPDELKKREHELSSQILIGFFKLPEMHETAEFAAIPSHVQNHIRRPTVPLWEALTVVGPPTAEDPETVSLGLAIFLQNPQSRGTIRLASANPKDAPVIDPAFLSHPFDRKNAILAMRKLMEFRETSAMKDIVEETAKAPASSSEEDILAWWTENGMATWHPSCTVRQGKAHDPMACLDSSFRVRGMEKLRVVDMSATPFLPNCHVQSVAYLIGECAAEKMIEEYGLDASNGTT